MYEVKIYNNGIETLIHYPGANAERPHLNNLSLKESLSYVDSLSFNIYSNNPGYNALFELTSKIKVIDTRDNTVRFSGRVLDISENMDMSGLDYKEILCEGALSYLNDTKVRDNVCIGSLFDVIQFILNNHNNKVENDKRIEIGSMDVTGSIAYTCSFKTTLETLLELKDKYSINGDIRIRETDGILYLDWLKSFSDSTINVELGVNMKDMVKGKDVTSLGTRIIPLGANNLTIKAVNGGLDYIEDANARANYGIIEKIAEYKDITDATDLYNACIADIGNYTQPLYLLETNAIDLSYLTGNKAEQFVLGANLHIVNPVMGVDDIYKIVSLELDLLKAYDPKIVIANAPVKLSTSINDLRKSSVQRESVINGVQVGDEFGIRAVRSDGKVITTMNATEGISIENQNEKVFSVDENGDIIANKGTYNEITTNNMVANDIIVEKGVITGATIQTSKPGSGKERLELTLDEFNSYNALGNLSFKIDGSRIGIYDDGDYVGSIYGAGNYMKIDLPSNRQFVISEGGYNEMVYYNGVFNFMGRINVNGGEQVATRAWVMQYVAENMPSSTP